MISYISFKKSDGETGSLKVTDAIADQESVALQNDAPTRISGSGFCIFL